MHKVLFFKIIKASCCFSLSELHYEALLVQSLFLMEELFISFSNQHFQHWKMAVLIAKKLFHFVFFFPRHLPLNRVGL